MNKLDRSGLAGALAERVRSLARAGERLGALDDPEASQPHVVGQADAEAILRGALLALSGHEGFDIARRILAGEQVEAAEDLATAGLVTWDPSSGALRPTALLVELMRPFDSAVSEAQAER